MSEPLVPRYGTPNAEMVRGWLALAPEQDGPFWAVNLMRYRPRAQYADGRPSTLTGRQADDAYAPVGPLAAVGAVPLFLADVVRQPTGTPLFERVAIVRYPSRAKFIEMQFREDFRELHAHKDAGMEFTIVASAAPPQRLDLDGPGSYVMRLRRLASGARDETAPPAAAMRGACLDLEGVIVGDERCWHEARLDRLVDEAALGGLLQDAEVEEQIAMLLGTPQLDKLAASTQM